MENKSEYLKGFSVYKPFLYFLPDLKLSTVRLSP